MQYENAWKLSTEFHFFLSAENLADIILILEKKENEQQENIYKLAIKPSSGWRIFFL